MVALAALAALRALPGADLAERADTCSHPPERLAEMGRDQAGADLADRADTSSPSTKRPTLRSPRISRHGPSA